MGVSLRVAKYCNTVPGDYPIFFILRDNNWGVQIRAVAAM